MLKIPPTPHQYPTNICEDDLSIRKKKTLKEIAEEDHTKKKTLKEIAEEEPAKHTYLSIQPITTLPQ